MTVSIRRATRGLLAIVGALTALSLGAWLASGLLRRAGASEDTRARMSAVFRLVFVGFENNLPTWYSSLSLACCAVLLALVARATRRAGAPFVRHWQGLAIIFGVLSLDEVAVLHERAGGWAVGLADGTGLFLFPWTATGLVLVAGFALTYARFALALPRGIRWKCVVAAGLFVGGALVTEMIEGVVVRAYGVEAAGYDLLSHVEELLEMLGVVVFLNALLSQLARFGGFEILVE